MKKLLLIAGIIVAIAVGASGVVTYAYYPRQSPDENESSDVVILANQEGLPEVTAFLDKYPGADIQIDRSGRVAVDYRVDRVFDDGTFEYLRLRVLSDSNGIPQEMFVDCYAKGQTQLTYDNIVDYIETETCLN